MNQRQSALEDEYKRLKRENQVIKQEKEQEKRGIAQDYEDKLGKMKEVQRDLEDDIRALQAQNDDLRRQNKEQLETAQKND